MPNNDYILRGDAVSAFCGNCEVPDICRMLKKPCKEVKQIKAIPAADVEPRKRWIPVTEGLPEQEGRYLVAHLLHNRFPWVTVMYFGVPDGYDKGICFYIADDEWGDVPCDYVTHWMPLPEPPKEERKEADNV